MSKPPATFPGRNTLKGILSGNLRAAMKRDSTSINLIVSSVLPRVRTHRHYMYPLSSIPYGASHPKLFLGAAAYRTSNCNFECLYPEERFSFLVAEHVADVDGFGYR